MTNAEMRKESGDVTSSDPLVTFIYLMVRDNLPSGAVEKLVEDVKDHVQPVEYSNGWIASYAKSVADRLRPQDPMRFGHVDPDTLAWARAYVSHAEAVERDAPAITEAG